jgi:hypothetical protein
MVMVWDGQMIRPSCRSKRLWRSVIVILMAYAVAAQSLLIVLGGFSALAQADPAAQALELCHHDADAAGLPASAPGYPVCNHCIFCFAGSHHAAIRPSPALFHRVDVAVIDAPSVANKGNLTRPSAHSIANPRGPPIVA